jgi:hypothetical protein
MADDMSEPQIPISRLPARRRGGAKPYILAGALGVVAGLVSFAFAVLRR